MAEVWITVKIMPKDTEVDLHKLEDEAKAVIEKEGGKVYKVEKEPVAFGLLALKITLTLDENKGTESLEKALAKIQNISSASIIDIRRAIG